MTTFDESMTYLIGFIDGAKKINSTFKSSASKSFRNGDNSVMNTYKNNTKVISGLEEVADAAIKAAETCSNAK